MGIIDKKLTLEVCYKDGNQSSKKEFKNFREITIDFDSWDDNDYLDDSIVIKLLNNYLINRSKIKIFIIEE